MPRLLALCIISVLITGKISAQKETRVKLLPDICLTPTEIELYRLINEYRAQRGLPTVRLSSSLCFVAKTHAIDQTANHQYGSPCNLHSWSADGNWSSCCYTADHRQAECMWDKPRELTNYKGDGFEIAFYSSFYYPSPEAFAKDILAGWKTSPDHNNVIINRCNWINVKWLVMGVGVYGEYADVWFGKVEDSAGAPGQCE